jgi:hypothetical protein
MKRPGCHHQPADHSAARIIGIVGRRFQSAAARSRLSTDTVRAEHSVRRISMPSGGLNIVWAAAPQWGQAVANDPSTAFAAVLHTLCLGTFYRMSSGTCLEISAKSASFTAQALGLADSASAKAIEVRHQQWAKLCHTARHVGEDRGPGAVAHAPIGGKSGAPAVLDTYRARPRAQHRRRGNKSQAIQ